MVRIYALYFLSSILTIISGSPQTARHPSTPPTASSSSSILSRDPPSRRVSPTRRVSYDGTHTPPYSPPAPRSPATAHAELPSPPPGFEGSNEHEYPSSDPATQRRRSTSRFSSLIGAVKERVRSTSRIASATHAPTPPAPSRTPSRAPASRRTESGGLRSRDRTLERGEEAAFAERGRTREKVSIFADGHLSPAKGASVENRRKVSAFERAAEALGFERDEGRDAGEGWKEFRKGWLCPFVLLSKP
jgi:hypothetical protein